jgi:hypothetical protein
MKANLFSGLRKGVRFVVEVIHHYHEARLALRLARRTRFTSGGSGLLQSNIATQQPFVGWRIPVAQPATKHA